MRPRNKKGILIITTFISILLIGCAENKTLVKKKAGAREDLGLSYIRQGNLKAGLEHLIEAAKLDPQNGNIQHELALTYKDLGIYGEALVHFKKALAFSQDVFLMTRVYFASHYARKTFDRELFTASLQTVLDTPADTVAQLTLLNTVAHQRAEELLQRADDFF